MHTDPAIKLFSDNEQFTKTTIENLKSEIILSKIIGIGEINFHILRNELNKEEKKILKEIIDFAKENNVKLIYEPDSFTKASFIFDLLKDFPEFGFNPDIGHIYLSFKRGNLGIDIIKFFKKAYKLC